MNHPSMSRQITHLIMHSIIYPIIHTLVILPRHVLFMFICDIILIGILTFIIYKKILKLFNKSYFYFDTICYDEVRDKQITQFTNILSHNTQKAIESLKCTKGMTSKFDLDKIKITVDTYINHNIKRDVRLAIQNSNTIRLDVNINEYINSVSQLICHELNRIASDNNEIIRFTFSMKNNCGSFEVNTIVRHNTQNSNHFIYEVVNYANATKYNLIKYNVYFHTFLLRGVISYYSEVKIIETSMIDGISQKYSMIPFNPEKKVDRYTNPDKNTISLAIKNFYGVDK
jgi:hypothetical protein